MGLLILKLICSDPECLAVTFIDSSIPSKVNKYVKCIKCGLVYKHG